MSGCRLLRQVSFLGYFAGCVDHNNMPVVSGDSKEEEGGWRSMFRPGPEPVRARVLMVDYVNKVRNACTTTVHMTCHFVLAWAEM